MLGAFQGPDAQQRGSGSRVAGTGEVANLGGEESYFSLPEFMNFIYIYIWYSVAIPPPMVMGQTSTPVVVVLWLGCGGLGLV